MENCNCKNNDNNGLLSIIVILLLILIGLGAYAAFQQTTRVTYEEVMNAVSEEAANLPIRTVEEAMIDYHDDRISFEAAETFFTIPPIIIQFLYEDLGTDLSIEEYVEHYEKNTTEYLKRYITYNTSIDIDKDIYDKIDTLKSNFDITVKKPVTDKIKHWLRDSL